MKTIILGAAESGVGAAILAQKLGHEVFVSEYGTLRPHYKEMLEAHHIAWEEGGHTLSTLTTADQIIKSPGIPDTAPMVVALQKAGIPILSEIEFAGRHTTAKMLCITGSNGKTTTTSLIYHIMKEAGYDVGLAGNIGKSLALQVATSPHEWYVVELSSFQLDNMYDFHSHISVLLNITPDHLDRYDNRMSLYVQAKMRILQNMTAADTFVYWGDDEYVPKELEQKPTPANCLTFTDKKENGGRAFLAEDAIVVNTSTPFQVKKEEIGIIGLHNMRNAMAAILACQAAGVAEASIRKGLLTFHGVEHRMEPVGTFGGVRYINDSKATNVDACKWALSAMTTPTVLIVGGKDKGNDYSLLYPLIQEKCCALIYLGADNSKLHEAFDHLKLPIADTNSMKACVVACKRIAQPGQTVLLSPCCASFDLFKNMEERGRMFKELVQREDIQ